MSSELMLILVVIALGFAGLYLMIRQLLQQRQSVDQLEDLINKVFGMSANKIAQQSKAILASEKETIKVDLENKQRVIEKMVQNLQEDLKKRQDEIRSIEQDRIKKFSQISTALQEHQKVTEDLKVSTKALSKILDNNQARGEWGERIIEDLLRSNGLVEGVHYLRQTQLGDSRLKPDIMLLLPNQRRVAVDVKFPYAEIQKMAMAETKSAKASHLKQFGRDLKTKVKKVAEYIDPEHNTLDYAIMFVPNEMIFSFVNQQLPQIVDEAIASRVLMVSPFTFLIVARTVMESYRNFMMEDKLKEVVKAVNEFTVEWGRFTEEFEKFGRSINTLSQGYEKLTTTRKKRMRRKIEKIAEYQQGGAKLIEG